MEEFTRLVKLMETLRGEEGCPWDKKQTEKGFKTFLLEEVYELIEAIEAEDYASVREELGDLLFHIVFISQICGEKQEFTIVDVVKGVTEKMYHRHPHIFRKEAPDVPIETRWEELKKAENEDYSPLRDVPRILPALLRAYVISKRASRIGFDWERLEDIYDKLGEEIRELKQAQASGEPESIREEIGDLLFTVANIARYQGIDPEDALRKTTAKFVRRFSYVEKRVHPGKTTLAEMDALWTEIKRKEIKGA